MFCVKLTRIFNHFIVLYDSYTAQKFNKKTIFVLKGKNMTKSWLKTHKYILKIVWFVVQFNIVKINIVLKSKFISDSRWQL